MGIGPGRFPDALAGGDRMARRSYQTQPLPPFFGGPDVAGTEVIPRGLAGRQSVAEALFGDLLLAGGGVFEGDITPVACQRKRVVRNRKQTKNNATGLD